MQNIYKGAAATVKKATYISTSDTKGTGVKHLKAGADTPFEVVHSIKAWCQIQALVEAYTADGNEISWFTPVIRDDKANTLYIPEIFIPEQEVTSVETDAPDLDLVIVDYLGAGYDIADLRGWFHLHPNMGVTPSAQDELQVEEFLDDGYETLLRGIINDKGDFKLDYYDQTANCIHTNLYNTVAWTEAESVPEVIAKAMERVTECVYVPAWQTGKKNAGANAYMGDDYEDYWNEGAYAYPTPKPKIGDDRFLPIGALEQDGSQIGCYESELRLNGEDAIVYEKMTGVEGPSSLNWSVWDVVEHNPHWLDRNIMQQSVKSMDLHPDDIAVLFESMIAFEPNTALFQA